MVCCCKNFVGTVIHSTFSVYKVGDYSDMWSKEAFEEFEGTITLTQ